jgi:hypothetical protein
MFDDFKPAPDHTKPVPPTRTSKPAEQKIATETTFQTPDQVAATGHSPLESQHAPYTAVVGSRPTSRLKQAFSWPPSKRTLIIAVILIILIGGALSGLLLTHHSKKVVVALKVPVKVVVKPVVATTVPSDLSGLPVSAAVNTRPVTGVMIENTTYARPQSGLGQAGVVFEAVAEGGVTRFLALYQDTQPGSVGPIRSLRPYYLAWAMGFDAAIAHVGGSPDALADVKSWDARDLDEFYNGSSYQRITSREAPHNVYTSIATLNQLEATKGYTSSTYTSWPRKADAPTKQPTAATINIALSGAIYNVQYAYDAATNSYNRSEGGAAQIDANTTTQLSPKVVITIVVPESQGALDASDAYYSDYSFIGSGVADVFQDGTLTSGQWSKQSTTGQITFTDSAGKPIKLDAGQTWITAITAPTAVTYTP